MIVDPNEQTAPVWSEQLALGCRVASPVHWLPARGRYSAVCHPWQPDLPPGDLTQTPLTHPFAVPAWFQAALWSLAYAGWFSEWLGWVGWLREWSRGHGGLLGWRRKRREVPGRHSDAPGVQSAAGWCRGGPGWSEQNCVARYWCPHCSPWSGEEWKIKTRWAS